MRHALTGQGSVELAADRARVWSALLDPQILRMLVPGADQIDGADNHYEARLSFGVGRLRGRFEVGLTLANLEPPRALDLVGTSRGLLGGGSANARVELTALGPARTRIAWTYDGVVTGPIAMAGTTLLQASSTLFVQRFFAAVARHVTAHGPAHTSAAARR